MWMWCPPSFRVTKKWIIRKSVGILVDAGSAQVPFLLKRWNEEVFLFTVCFLRQGLIIWNEDWSCAHGTLPASSWATMPGRGGLFCEWIYVCSCQSMAGVFLLALPLLSSLFLLIFCVSIAGGAGRIFCLHIWLSYIHASSNLWRSEQDVRSLRTGIRSGCGPLCGCWKLNSGALEEQPVLLTSEPSLQPFYLIFEAGSLTETGYLVSFRDLHISASQLWVCRGCLAFYMSARDRNSSPPTCRASTLLTEALLITWVPGYKYRSLVLKTYIQPRNF